MNTPLMTHPTARPFTATRNSMPTETTTHDTTFTAPRNPTNSSLTTKTAARRSVRNARVDRDRTPDHADELRASQLVHVAAEEVTWFFTSYDSAPAARLARATIASWIGALDPDVRRTLALRFDVSPWAEDLQEEGLRSGFALAVSLVSTAKWNPKSGPRNGPHRRAGEHLEAAVRTRGISVMCDIGRRADWDFASAVSAYAKARGRAPSVLPRCAA